MQQPLMQLFLFPANRYFELQNAFVRGCLNFNALDFSTSCLSNLKQRSANNVRLLYFSFLYSLKYFTTLQVATLSTKTILSIQDSQIMRV